MASVMAREGHSTDACNERTRHHHGEEVAEEVRCLCVLEPQQPCHLGEFKSHAATHHTTLLTLLRTVSSVHPDAATVTLIIVCPYIQCLHGIADEV